MRKATIIIFLMVLIALTPLLVQQTSSSPLDLRRSRFLANHLYACTKKNQASICMAAGSPGATCCDGSCVDIRYSSQHCGICNRTCKHQHICCQGNCVDVFSDDKHNCGGCGISCKNNCTKGSCDYAA